jgi:Sec-independent protein translocase protein TatA
MGRQLGKGMREFKDSIAGKDEPAPDQLSAELPPVEPEAEDAQPRERDAVH